MKSVKCFAPQLVAWGKLLDGYGYDYLGLSGESAAQPTCPGSQETDVELPHAQLAWGGAATLRSVGWHVALTLELPQSHQYRDRPLGPGQSCRARDSHS